MLRFIDLSQDYWNDPVFHGGPICAFLCTCSDMFIKSEDGCHTFSDKEEILECQQGERMLGLVPKGFFTTQGERKGNLIIGDTASVDFQARIVIYDGLIQELEVFTWEVEPFDPTKRTGREWARESLSETDLSDLAGLLEWGDYLEGEAYESVFKGTISSTFTGPDADYDEELHIHNHLTVQFPNAKECFE
jgi:hypothetical protein